MDFIKHQQKAGSAERAQFGKMLVARRCLE